MRLGDRPLTGPRSPSSEGTVQTTGEAEQLAWVRLITLEGSFSRPLRGLHKNATLSSHQSISGAATESQSLNHDGCVGFSRRWTSGSHWDSSAPQQSSPTTENYQLHMQASNHSPQAFASQQKPEKYATSIQVFRLWPVYYERQTSAEDNVVANLDRLIVSRFF